MPQDALILINELHAAKFADSVGTLPASRPSGSHYYDVNGDGFIAPQDALHVINRLNSDGRSEGESPADATPPRLAWPLLNASAQAASPARCPQPGQPSIPTTKRLPVGDWPEAASRPVERVLHRDWQSSHQPRRDLSLVDEFFGSWSDASLPDEPGERYSGRSPSSCR